MATIFTRIIQGEIPCHKLYEDSLCFAFLDINPINPGHTLVVSREETDYLFDLDDDLLKHMMGIAKKIGLAIDRAVDCDRVGIIVAGLEVPHAHIHLVPITGIGDINFANAKPSTQEDLAAIAARVHSHLS